jgi:hypothetical protein
MLGRSKYIRLILGWLLGLVDVDEIAITLGFGNWILYFESRSLGSKVGNFCLLIVFGWLWKDSRWSHHLVQWLLLIMDCKRCLWNEVNLLITVLVIVGNLNLRWRSHCSLLVKLHFIAICILLINLLIYQWLWIINKCLPRP